MASLTDTVSPVTTTYKVPNYNGYITSNGKITSSQTTMSVCDCPKCGSPSLLYHSTKPVRIQDKDYNCDISYAQSRYMCTDPQCKYSEETPDSIERKETAISTAKELYDSTKWIERQFPDVKE